MKRCDPVVQDETVVLRTNVRDGCHHKGTGKGKKNVFVDDCTDGSVLQCFGWGSHWFPTLQTETITLMPRSPHVGV